MATVVALCGTFMIEMFVVSPYVVDLGIVISLPIAGVVAGITWFVLGKVGG